MNRFAWLLAMGGVAGVHSGCSPDHEALASLPSCRGPIITGSGGCAVSISDLLENPRGYDGAEVQLYGYIHSGPKGSAIYSTNEDFGRDAPGRMVNVSLADGESSSGCQGAFVMVNGTFRANFRRFWGQEGGGVVDIAECFQNPPIRNP
jgi:hypothetical protein